MKILCIGWLLNTDILVKAPSAVLVLRPADAKHLSLFQSAQTGSEPIQSPIQLVLEALSLGVKQIPSKAYHLNLSSAKVQNNWSNASTPSYAFTACIRTTLPLPLLDTKSTAKVGLTMLL